MSMSNVEVQHIVDMVVKALRPICEDWVERAQAQVPYMVRQALEDRYYDELHALIHKKVHETIEATVTVKLKEAE